MVDQTKGECSCIQYNAFFQEYTTSSNIFTLPEHCYQYISSVRWTYMPIDVLIVSVISGKLFNQESVPLTMCSNLYKESVPYQFLSVIS